MEKPESVEVWVEHTSTVTTPVRYKLECLHPGCDGLQPSKTLPVDQGWHSSKEEALHDARLHASRRGHKVKVSELRLETHAK